MNKAEKRDNYKGRSNRQSKEKKKKIDIYIAGQTSKNLYQMRAPFNRGKEQ